MGETLSAAVGDVWGKRENERAIPGAEDRQRDALIAQRPGRVEQEVVLGFRARRLTIIPGGFRNVNVRAPIWRTSYLHR